jgi:hypothetical protein
VSTNSFLKAKVYSSCTVDMLRKGIGAVPAFSQVANGPKSLKAIASKPASKDISSNQTLVNGSHGETPCREVGGAIVLVLVLVRRIAINNPNINIGRTLPFQR